MLSPHRFEKFQQGIRLVRKREEVRGKKGIFCPSPLLSPNLWRESSIHRKLFGGGFSSFFLLTSSFFLAPKGLQLFWLVIWLCLLPAPLRAQITPDGTTSTTLDVNGNTVTINDGDRAGGNLFHSFGEFSVPTGSEAFFNNAPDVVNIINRVTGGNISNIDGLIRALGSANLFLINPNGIVFGPNARLDVGGSFFGTSADSLKFADGSEFSAVNPQSPPLLTINIPIGLQYGANPGSIQVIGDGQGRRTSDSPIIDTQNALRVQPDKTLALVGGDLNLEGATLKTAGGRIELGSVAGDGLVGLVPIEKGFSLDYSGVENFGDINLSQTATVDASGLVSGDILLQGNNITLTNGSTIEASTLGNMPTQETPGIIEINASDTINIDGESSEGISSGAYSQVYPDAVGNAGGISITTGSLEVTNGARLDASTFGQGDAGSVTINANDLVKFDGEAEDGFPSGASSTVELDAVGNAGGISITTGSLEVTNGAWLSAITGGQGDVGSVTIKANDLVKFDGEAEDGNNSWVFSLVWLDAVGNAGGISITTGSLEVTNDAWLSAFNLGQGDVGSITINAHDLVKFDGESWVFSSVWSDDVGNAGGVSITTGSLEVTNDARLSASTFGQGDGGDLTIQTGQLMVQDNAEISAQTSGAGMAGNLQINADEVEVSGFGSGLFSRTGGTGDAGTLTINTSELRIIDNAQVGVNNFIGRC